jgi:hypothetical protein
MTTTSARADRLRDRARRHEEGAARVMDGFVRTPATLAEQITSRHVGIGALPHGGLVLEPSAGDGALVRAVLTANRDAHVIAVEPNGPRAEALRALADEYPGQITVHECTFEVYAAAHPDTRVDAVVMNPPFGTSTADRVWIAHVRLAAGQLNEGAQLISVVPGSYGNQTRVCREFREWAEAGYGARWENLPAGSFKESGIGVHAVLLTLTRPLPARPDGLPVWLYAPTAGEPVAMPGRPNLAASGVLATPVQEFSDFSDGHRPRVLRFAGVCHGCSRLLWAFDGSSDAAAWEASAADAETFGKVGPSVALCLACENDAAAFAAALAAVDPYWTDAPTTVNPGGPVVYPMDLCADLWATVAGVDYRGWAYTITGRVMADPKPVERNGEELIMVRLRQATGLDVELYAREDERVTVRDVPADVVPGHREEPATVPAVELPAAPIVSGWSAVLQPVLPGC